MPGLLRRTVISNFFFYAGLPMSDQFFFFNGIDHITELLQTAVVGIHNHQYASVSERIYHLIHRCSISVIETACRLIKKNDLRMIDQCSAYRKTLFLTAAELTNLMVIEVIQIHLFQQMHDLIFFCLLRMTESEIYILVYCHLFKKLEILKYNLHIF